MAPARLFWLSGWVSVLCGLCIVVDTLVVELFLPETLLTNSVGHFGLILGPLVLLSVYLWQRASGGYLGDIGFIVNFLGLALILGVMFFKNYVQLYLSQDVVRMLLAGPVRAVFLGSALFFMLGVILFGIATLRAGVFPRLAALLYMVGFVLFSLEPLLPDVVARTAQVSGALGIMGFGYTLIAGQRAPRATGAMPGSVAGQVGS